ncbi:MAG: hypothetical protein ACKOA1_05980 [Bacteroidota bacterium]
MKTSPVFKSKIFFFAFTFSAVAFGCGNAPKTEEQSTAVKDTVAVKDTAPEVVVRPVHPYFNSIMNYISGKQSAPITFSLDTAFFNKYCEELGKNIVKINENRLSKIQSWYMNVLKSNSRNDTLPVFYPFSGGDFLHMNCLYPNSRDYVMMAIEPVGYFPDLDSMAIKDKNSLLTDVNYNMRDVLNKSYFITHNMHSDLRSKKLITGMILPIFWGLGVTDHEIIDVLDASFDSAGAVVIKPISGKKHNFTKGVQIVFRKKGDTREKSITYFKVDISDDGFKSDAPMTKYLAAKAPYNSFLKAASYLPHYGTFSSIRNNILAKTQNHVQDDTGIPYRYFTPDSFTARVFGKYTTPVADFSANLFQKDLARAYSDSTIYGGRLDFSMGYHWANSEQNELVFMRK